MQLADEVIALQYGTPEFETLRDNAKNGDPDALKFYVYFCAWQAIRGDKYIPQKEKARIFRTLVDSDLIGVSLGR